MTILNPKQEKSQFWKYWLIREWLYSAFNIRFRWYIFIYFNENTDDYMNEFYSQFVSRLMDITVAFMWIEINYIF